MFGRTVVVTALTAAALVLAAPSFAKGPSEAEVDGPGLNAALTFRGDGEDGGSTLGRITEDTGFFPAAFGQEPDPMLGHRPKGDLGPRYTITFTVPGPDGTADEIHQDLYPYAPGGAVTYMAPGQELFVSDRTRGGWYAAPSTLKPTLVDAGLPESPPATTGDGSAFHGRWPLAVGALVLALLVAAAVGISRRRPRPAPTL